MVNTLKIWLWDHLQCPGSSSSKKVRLVDTDTYSPSSDSHTYLESLSSVDHFFNPRKRLKVCSWVFLADGKNINQICRIFAGMKEPVILRKKLSKNLGETRILSWGWIYIHPQTMKNEGFRPQNMGVCVFSGFICHHFRLIIPNHKASYFRRCIQGRGLTVRFPWTYLQPEPATRR